MHSVFLRSFQLTTMPLARSDLSYMAAFIERHLNFSNWGKVSLLKFGDLVSQLLPVELLIHGPLQYPPCIPTFLLSNSALPSILHPKSSFASSPSLPAFFLQPFLHPKSSSTERFPLFPFQPKATRSYLISGLVFLHLRVPLLVLLRNPRIHHVGFHQARSPANPQICTVRARASNPNPLHSRRNALVSADRSLQGRDILLTARRILLQVRPVQKEHAIWVVPAVQYEAATCAVAAVLDLSWVASRALEVAERYRSGGERNQILRSDCFPRRPERPYGRRPTILSFEDVFLGIASVQTVRANAPRDNFRLEDIQTGFTTTSPRSTCHRRGMEHQRPGH
jgi:hypothetical protein